MSRIWNVRRHSIRNAMSVQVSAKGPNVFEILGHFGQAKPMVLPCKVRSNSNPSRCKQNQFKPSCSDIDPLIYQPLSDCCIHYARAYLFPFVEKNSSQCKQRTRPFTVSIVGETINTVESDIGDSKKKIIKKKKGGHGWLFLCIFI